MLIMALPICKTAYKLLAYRLIQQKPSEIAATELTFASNFMEEPEVIRPTTGDSQEKPAGVGDDLIFQLRIMYAGMTDRFAY